MAWSIETFNNCIKDLVDAYFGEGEAVIKVKNTANRNAEEQIMEYLDKGEINAKVVAWKAGRLIEKDGKYLPKTNEDNNYLNGYGRPIDKDQLEKYLEYTRNQWHSLENDDKTSFSKIYPKFVKTFHGESIVPSNFGSVYIINLIFFLSKGELPIYDKFAHKAAKALFMDKHPNEVYVGAAPGKYEIKEVINLYSEYLWLLEQLFGKYSINRDIDRALWIYGHVDGQISLLR